MYFPCSINTIAFGDRYHCECGDPGYTSDLGVLLGPQISLSQLVDWSGTETPLLDRQRRSSQNEPWIVAPITNLQLTK